MEIAFFSELLIEESRAERNRIDFNMLRNSRRTKKSHTSWSFRKQQSKGRGQTTLLLTKLDCLSNSHS